MSFRNVEKEKSIKAIEALSFAKEKLVVSNDKIRQFAANGIYHDFINIGNLINSKFKVSINKPISKEIRLVTLGAFTPIKDQRTILDALKIIDSSNICHFAFTWVGIDGWGSNKINEVLELLRYYDFRTITINLKPMLNRDEVAKELNDSDVFIFSSISEGMPVSVLEALACGIPVFTSNCGGVDEVINEKNGKIYPIKDSVKLSELIMEFAYTKNTYDKKQISRDVINKYGEFAFKNRLMSVYNSIL
jgi:glycosyltransferase involved in cell wall biosynthesis